MSTGAAQSRVSPDTDDEFAVAATRRRQPAWSWIFVRTSRIPTVVCCDWPPLLQLLEVSEERGPNRRLIGLARTTHQASKGDALGKISLTVRLCAGDQPQWWRPVAGPAP